MDKVLKSIIRLVRNQKNQQVINIPADVKNCLGLKGGDAVGFIIFESGRVLLVRVDPVDLIKHIGSGA
jgi:bifunctional DNA-binding transcriptional regulator/antitoxin component of YhaV-PrlF toxin-antitoxin module